ncbi:MAG: hypothetical protein ACJ0OB_03680 [Flavobacteriaceae bacterium]
MYATNLQTELFKIKKKSSNNSLLYDFNLSSFSDFNYEKLESNKIFHISDIKKTCIDYRLRFLNFKYFKGDIPGHAKTQVKSFKNDHRQNILDLKIMAPSKLFKLKNADDPLLFTSLGNDYFYLIDKWGNDLSYFRKISMWPFKSLTNILIFVSIISIFLTMLIPKGIFVYDSSPKSEFFITYLFMLKSVIAIVIFFGFSLGKNFNTAIWNRKYFN